MHLSATAHYAAGLDRVVAMLADEAFVAAKVRACGAVSQQVDVVRLDSGAFTVTTRRHMPTTEIPAQFRSIVGASLEVRQVEAWEAPGDDASATPGRTGTVVVEITGAPVRMTGTLRLEPGADGVGTTQVFEGELKASVPLFAAAVEEATAGAVRAAIAAEERTAQAWLAR